MRNLRARGGQGGHEVSLIVHRFESERVRRMLEPGSASSLMVPLLLSRLRQDGFLRTIHLESEVAQPRSSAAILHVNATRVPDDYARLATSFRQCINGRVLDISKRTVSTSLADESWSGGVIAKSDLNFHGRPEVMLNEEARRVGRPEPFAGARRVDQYTIYPSPSMVPSEVRDDPSLVLERFLPEPDPKGFAIRHWIFCGERGYCNRYVSAEEIVKGRNIVSKEPVPVPRELRRWRRRHGLDVGKLDFVVHQGRTVLIDVNKTPGAFPSTVPDAEASIATLAQGLADLIAERS